MDVKNCPLCGASSFSEVFKAPYFRGDGEKFRIVECEDCQLWFTNPRPADDELGAYYETGEYISHTSQKKSAVDYLYHTVRNISLKRKLKLINGLHPKKGHLLDYGAGTGHFLKTAQAGGWQISGVEESESARKVAKNENGLDLNAPQNFNPDSSFEAITMWHVLEHLPDLRGPLQKFHSWLKPNGHLIVAVPNHQSWDAEMYKENWAALDVPLHLYHFKKTNFKRIADDFGFELTEIRNMPFDSFYVSLLSEKIESGGGTNFIRAFWRGLQSNLKGMPDKNASSLIYILKKVI